MKEQLILGLDIGGTHVTCSLINISRQTLIKESYVRRPLNSYRGFEEIISRIVEVIELSVDSALFAGLKIGIAIPGPFDYDNGICLISEQEKFASLYKKNIRTALSERLNINPLHLRFCNDAACYLKGEVVAGIAFGRRKVVGLTLGTGLGSAIYEDGKVYDADLWCSPFQDGIAENFISSEWIMTAYSQMTNKEVANVKSIADLSREDKLAREVFHEFGGNIGRFIVKQFANQDFEMVVLGGNISNAFDLFIEPLNAVLAENNIKISVQRTILGEDASLMGAAALWLAESEIESVFL